MQLVRFNQGFGAYRGGETAGFSPEEAAHLCDKLNVAVRVDPKEEARLKKAAEAKAKKEQDEVEAEQKAAAEAAKKAAGSTGSGS